MCRASKELTLELVLFHYCSSCRFFLYTFCFLLSFLPSPSISYLFFFYFLFFVFFLFFWAWVTLAASSSKEASGGQFQATEKRINSGVNSFLAVRLFVSFSLRRSLFLLLFPVFFPSFLFLPFPIFSFFMSFSLFSFFFSEPEILWPLVQVKKHQMASSKPPKKGLTLELILFWQFVSLSPSLCAPLGSWNCFLSFSRDNEVKMKELTLDLILLEKVQKAPKCLSMPKQTTKNSLWSQCWHKLDRQKDWTPKLILVMCMLMCTQT